MRILLFALLSLCLGAAPFRPAPSHVALRSYIKGETSFECESEVYKDGNLYKYLYRFRVISRTKTLIRWSVLGGPNLPLFEVTSRKAYVVVHLSKSPPVQKMKAVSLYRGLKSSQFTYYRLSVNGPTMVWVPGEE